MPDFAVSRRYFFFGSLLAGAVPAVGFGSQASLKALGYKPFNEKLNLAGVGVAAFADTPSGGDRQKLSGRVILTEKGKPSKERGLDLASGAVWFEPEGGAPHPPPVATRMRTFHKQFDPRLLVVPVGSTVAFPNGDPILHNVFSVSRGNAFDLGLVGAGKGKSANLREPGIVRVFCNVHHAMFAHVVVVDTPYAAQIAPDGSFELDGLPAGPGTLHVWQERADPLEQRIELPRTEPLEIRLEVTQPRVPPHLNKFGRSYYGDNAYDG